MLILPYERVCVFISCTICVVPCMFSLRQPLIMATLLPSDNVSCHRALIYPRALFMDPCASADHCAHTAVLAGPTWPSLRSAVLLQQLPTCISSRKRSAWPHDPLFEEGPGGYPKAGQAQSNYTPGRHATLAEL